MSTPTPTIIESNEATALFPTFVWQYQISKAVYEPLNEHLLAALEALKPVKEPVPMAKMWQTDQDLHLREEFSELTGYIRSAVDGVLEFQKAVHQGFEITGCWANFSGLLTSHRPHMHPNNYLSGVYYVKAGEGARQINFVDPRSQRHIIDPHVSAFDLANAGEVAIEVQPGLLAVFPAWLQHSVPPNNSGEERISISFNIMFKDYSGTISRPRWSASPWPQAN